MNSTPDVPDPRLAEAHDLALAALREITAAETIGDPVGHTVEADGSVSLRFENRMLGYPGWFWTVTVGVVDDAEPTVLETELLPGDGALLAPDWVPWDVRLAEYQEAQAEADERSRADDESSGDSEGDPGEADSEDEADDDFDEDDFASDGSPILHSGDVDGVDIDALGDDPDESGDDESGDDSDEYGDMPEDEEDDSGR